MAKREVKGQEAKSSDERMPLGKRNYIWMLIGMGVVIVGFILMAGGGSKDPKEFNEAMFSFRRITLAPILVVAGFILVGVGIMRRFKK